MIVEFLGVTPALRLEIISVSGTELLVKFPDNADPVCVDATGLFRVTLLERVTLAAIGTATGGNFTYLGNQPLVTNVLPRFIQTGGSGNWVDPSAITIYGRDFASEVYVDIGTGDGHRQRLDSSSVTVVSPEQINLINLPTPNDFNLQWQTTSCITQLGEEGIRLVPTAIDVTVTNFPSDGPDECNDTLLGALVYEPEDTTCALAATLVAVLDPVLFPDADAPNCTQAQMDVQNPGLTSASILISSVSLDDRFFLDAGFSQFVNPGVTLAAGQTWSRTVLFCPDVADGTTHNGTATISYSDSLFPTQRTLTVGLRGTELQARRIAVADATGGGTPLATGDTVAWPLTNVPAPVLRNLTITNGGEVGLAISGVTLSGVDAARYTIGPSPVSPVAPGASTTLGVTLTPAPGVADLDIAADLTITSDADDFPSFVIHLHGEYQP